MLTIFSFIPAFRSKGALTVFERLVVFHDALGNIRKTKNEETMWQSTTSPEPVASPSASAPRRLLVVDDEPGICELIADVAEGVGYEVRMEHDPCEIWTMLASFTPSVIVLDLEMPHMDGVTVLQSLAEEGCNAAILLISGLADGTLSRAERIGRDLGLHVVGSITKPFSVARLEEMLSALFAEAEDGRP